MNSLAGHIASVVTEGNLSLVKISPDICPDEQITAIVIDDAAIIRYLQPGNAVTALFKETEVIIAKDFSGQISVQNRFPCTIKNVEKGRLLARLLLDYHGTELSSIITVNAVNKLQLKEGDQVTALVKTNEISITPA